MSIKLCMIGPKGSEENIIIRGHCYGNLKLVKADDLKSKQLDISD